MCTMYISIGLLWKMYISIGLLWKVYSVYNVHISLGLLWKVYSAIKKSTRQPASVFVLERAQLDKFDRYTI